MIGGVYIVLKDVVRTLCIFFSSFFYISFLYTGLVTTLLHTLYFILIHMMMMYVLFTYLCMCCFFSLFIHIFFMYSIFISVSNMMPWWVLFKCFRKTGCESLSCHELSSCKVFQEFVIRIDLFCNTTSGYEFSDLRFLSWLFVLLLFCHGLPKGEIVRDTFYVIG